MRHRAPSLSVHSVVGSGSGNTRTTNIYSTYRCVTHARDKFLLFRHQGRDGNVFPQIPTPPFHVRIRRAIGRGRSGGGCGPVQLCFGAKTGLGLQKRGPSGVVAMEKPRQVFARQTELIRFQRGGGRIVVCCWHGMRVEMCWYRCCTLCGALCGTLCWYLC